MKISNELAVPRTKVPTPEAPVMMPSPQPSPIGHALSELGATSAAIAKNANEDIERIRKNQYFAAARKLQHEALWGENGYLRTEGEDAIAGGGYKARVNESLSKAFEELDKNYPTGPAFDAYKTSVREEIFQQSEQHAVIHQLKQQDVLDEQSMRELMVSNSTVVMSMPRTPEGLAQSKEILDYTIGQLALKRSSRTNPKKFQSEAAAFISATVRNMVESELDKEAPDMEAAKRILDTPWLPGGKTGQQALITEPGRQEDQDAIAKKMERTEKVIVYEGWVSSLQNFMQENDYDQTKAFEFIEGAPEDLRSNLRREAGGLAAMAADDERRVQQRAYRAYNTALIKAGGNPAGVPRPVRDAVVAVGGAELLWNAEQHFRMRMEDDADAPAVTQDQAGVFRVLSMRPDDLLMMSPDEFSRIRNGASKRDRQLMDTKRLRAVEGPTSFTTIEPEGTVTLMYAKRYNVIPNNKSLSELGDSKLARYSEFVMNVQKIVQDEESIEGKKVTPLRLRQIWEEVGSTTVEINGEKIPSAALTEEDRRKYIGAGQLLKWSEGVFSPQQEEALRTILTRRKNESLSPGEASKPVSEEELKQSMQSFLLRKSDPEINMVMNALRYDRRKGMLWAHGMKSDEELKASVRAGLSARYKKYDENLVASISNAALDGDPLRAKQLADSAPDDTTRSKEEISRVGAGTASAQAAQASVIKAAEERVTEEPSKPKKTFYEEKLEEEMPALKAKTKEEAVEISKKTGTPIAAYISSDPYKQGRAYIETIGADGKSEFWDIPAGKDLSLSLLEFSDWHAQWKRTGKRGVFERMKFQGPYDEDFVRKSIRPVKGGYPVKVIGFGER